MKAGAPSQPRWIPPNELGGAWQMAIDEWLLDTMTSPVLRLYRWCRPTLSLGFHQRPEPLWRHLADQGVMDLIRRPSGGRAVLHGGDLTYALIWPDAPRSRLEAYDAACRWPRQAFEDLGLPLQPGRQVASLGQPSCFATHTAADLIHPVGAKRIGSAQLWRRGSLLQHGSILLDPSVPLWRQVFGVEPPDLPPLPVDLNGLIGSLRGAATRWAGERWAGAAGVMVTANLSAEELAAIAPRLERYRLDPTTSCPSGPGITTSPDATMARAT